MKSRFVVDTNVPVSIGNISNPECNHAEVELGAKCLVFVEELLTNSEFSIALDSNGEILKEYTKYYEKIQGSIMSQFFTWVFEQRSLHYSEVITEIDVIGENQYHPYPADSLLEAFDPPDRKFIAVAYSHADQPAIIEAADSKWIGIKNNLKKAGIKINFIDEPYLANIYQKKIGK